MQLTDVLLAPVHAVRLTVRAADDLNAIAERAHAYAMEMDFKFLYDERRKLFSIGYQVGANTVDGSYYDLLASEARLASFLAIARDDVPVDPRRRAPRGPGERRARDASGTAARGPVRAGERGGGGGGRGRRARPLDPAVPGLAGA